MNTFIRMLVSITDPVVIERGYQILAAKRDLLAHKADAKCPAKVDLESSKTYSQLRLEQETARVEGSYKLAPSLDDVRRYRFCSGEFVLRLRYTTPEMRDSGFHTGQPFKLITLGYERSHVRKINSHRKAIIKNQYLESAFRFDCGCYNGCACWSARNN